MYGLPQLYHLISSSMSLKNLFFASTLPKNLSIITDRYCKERFLPSNSRYPLYFGSYGHQAAFFDFSNDSARLNVQAAPLIRSLRSLVIRGDLGFSSIYPPSLPFGRDTVHLYSVGAPLGRLLPNPPDTGLCLCGWAA